MQHPEPAPAESEPELMVPTRPALLQVADAMLELALIAFVGVFILFAVFTGLRVASAILSRD